MKYCNCLDNKDQSTCQVHPPKICLIKARPEMLKLVTGFPTNQVFKTTQEASDA